MASNYSANQYENAFASKYLQNWSIAKDNIKHPETHEGYTQIIANDRGHLLPSVPRSKASPWGTFMDTWKMPLQIPPARVDLTGRTAAAANRLVNWVQKNPDLLNACNGLRPEIRGHPQQPRPSGSDQSPKTQEKTATPQAMQESPHPSLGVNVPPSRGLPDASPAPPSPPPPNVICSCSCSCSCSSPSKTSHNSPKTPESSNGHNGHNEPEGQIQEKNTENYDEAPQEVTGAKTPLSPKETME
ncbi:protein Flattop [Macrotis lagotis]|uniref:protein Flattop n=1 Tax=Macrotis lagotis TaxID=92651 RepID=UPI003D6849CE